MLRVPSCVTMPHVDLSIKCHVCKGEGTSSNVHDDCAWALYLGLTGVAGQMKSRWALASFFSFLAVASRSTGTSGVLPPASWLSHSVLSVQRIGGAASILPFWAPSAE